MKIVLHTPARLIVHDGVAKTVVMGTIFAAAGGGLITAFRTDHPGWFGSGSWLVYFVGGLFVLVGIVLFTLSADRRFEFDGVTRTARVIVRRLAHRTTAEYRFDSLKDVLLEHSGNDSRNSQDFYRIVFLTQTGERIPWTPYTTNGQGTLAICASAVRAFCGWAGEAGQTKTGPVPAPHALSGHPLATNWGCAGAFLAVFAAIGLGIFGAEVYRLYAWQPVDARVLSTDVRSVRGSKGGTSYAPVVRYRYTFAGQQYESDRVLPINISASRRWAEGMRTRFHPDQGVTAYANPSQPSSAYLVHEVSLLPLAFVGLPLVIFGLFSWIVWAQRRQLAAIQVHQVPIVEA